MSGIRPKSWQVAVLVASVAFAASAFSVYDDLIFDLGLLNPSSAATNPATSDILNLTTWSGATRETASAVSTFTGGAHPEFGTPAPIGHGTLVTPHAYHYYEASKTRPVLAFPVNTNYVAETDKTWIYPQVVTFPKPICNGSNITVFVRFKVDSNVPYKNSNAHIRYIWDNMQTVKDPSTGQNRSVGWRIAYQATPDRPENQLYMRNFIGNTSILDYQFPFSVGVWYAMVFTFATNPETGVVTMSSYTTSIANSPRGETHDVRALTSTTKSFAAGNDIAVPAGTTGKSYIGGRSVLAGYTDWAEISGDRCCGLCGSIAEARVYDRAFSKAEALALLAEADGASFATGSANGSADEFAAADDSAVEEIFEPKTMTPRQMRKSLTAAHPSLVLKVPVPYEEEGLEKILRLKPILSGVTGRAPFDVRINGGLVATGDFARPGGGDAYIRRGRLKRGDGGFATIEVRRTGNLAGTVSFDAVTLTGAWAAGARENWYTSNAFKPIYYLFASHTASSMSTPIGGTPGEPYLFDMLYGTTSAGGRWYPETTISFDLPEVMIRTCACSYEFAPRNLWHEGEGTKASIHLNGTQIGFLDEMYNSQIYRFALDKALLKPGMNTVRIVSEGPKCATGGDYNAFYFKYHLLDVKRPKAGFAVFVPEPPEDANRLVRRTDFKTSSTWDVRTIEDRGFLPMFRQVYWTGASRTTAPLDMYRDCVDVMWGGRSDMQRNDIVSGGSGEAAMIAGGYARCAREDEKYPDPYTFPEFFGPSLTSLREGAEHAGNPFFIRMTGDRPSFFLNASYPLADNASYTAWRNAQTHFVTTYTLMEFDTEAMWYRAYSGACTDTVARAAMRAAFPFPPSGTSEEIFQRDYFKPWVDESVVRERQYYFGETNFWTLCSGCPSLQHIMADAGACGVSYEATTQGAGSWTVPGAFTRGAARQFGIPFTWYCANFTSGYKRDGTPSSGENSTALDPSAYGYSFKRDGGASRSLINRQISYGWLIGAATVEPENWYHYHMEEVAKKQYVASGFAQDLQALCDRAKTTDRGVSYTPLAVLVPLLERHSRGYGDYNRRDQWSMPSVFLTLEPPNQEQDGVKLYELARSRGDESCFFNSPFGGIYDVICPDATRNRADILRTLDAYKAAVVAGDFRTAEIPEGVFEAYAARGGTLIVSGDRVKTGLVDPAAAGVTFGSSTVAAGGALYHVGRNAKVSDLTAAYSVMVPSGTPTATPFYRDGNGNVLVYVRNWGKGRIVTVACDQMLPDAYAKCAQTHAAHNAKLLEAAAPGFRFELLHTILAAVQDETMPVKVEGDVQWGANRCGSGRWLVWLFNNRGVTKFIGEPEELDAAKTATVSVTCNGLTRTVSVPPGGIVYLTY